MAPSHSREYWTPIHHKVYVVECLRRHHFYVGTTFRELWARISEHEYTKGGFGSKWTRRHGFKRLVCWMDCTAANVNDLEDEMTAYLMERFGVRRVRGGKHNNCRADAHDVGQEWWLPVHLRPGYVAPLHGRPVSKFSLELNGLIDRFESAGGFEDADHLHA